MKLRRVAACTTVVLSLHSVAEATVVNFYNPQGDVLAVDFLYGAGGLLPDQGGSGPGQVFTVTLNGVPMVPPLYDYQQEPYFFAAFSANSVSLIQVWHEGTINVPGPIHTFMLDASGPFFEGGMSLEEYQGPASGQGTYIAAAFGSVYSVGRYPLPAPASLPLLAIGLLGLTSLRMHRRE